MKAGRLDRIEEYVRKRGNATLIELADAFQVSINTIRRDIAELVGRGKLTKVYGGVTINNALVAPMTIRESSNSNEKERIGELAASLVQDGDTIYLDAGSTTPYILPWLENRSHLTVITHNMKALDIASKLSNITLIAIGGEYVSRTSSFSGLAVNADLLNHYHISKAFLATTAISAKYGLTNTSFLEAEIKRRIVAASESIILMADHTKFARSAVISFCELSALSGIVTDQCPDEDLTQRCSELGIQLLY